MACFFAIAAIFRCFWQLLDTANVGALLCSGAVFSLNYGALLGRKFAKFPRLSSLWALIKDAYHAWRSRRKERRSKGSDLMQSTAHQVRVSDADGEDSELPSLLGIRTAVQATQVHKKAAKGR